MTRFMLGCALVLTLCGVVSAGAAARPAPQTVPRDALDPRTYAPDSKLYLLVHAIGVQKYACQASGAWLFTDPDADLFKATRKPAGSHFLNFATGRPVWRWKDGSPVEAARAASAAAGAANIPWLLLQGVATSAGDEGDRLADTTWVQRLNTSGGVAPAGACSPGETRAVPYEADYLFWKAKPDQDESDH
jgi:hypothetical protein